MHYTVLIMKPAIKELERLPTRDQIRIRERMTSLSNNLAGDVKRLKDYTPAYRLRVGDYRVLFDVEGTLVIVRTIGHRRDIYGR